MKTPRKVLHGPTRGPTGGFLLHRPGVAFVLVPLVIVVALAGCLVLEQTSYEIDATHEIDEDSPAELAALGQSHCIVEAAANQPSEACPSEATGIVYPQSGIRVLDAAYVVPLGPSNPEDGPQRGDPIAGLNHLGYDLLRGTNTERASGGEVAAVVTPGPGQFIAFLGRWNNLDGDGNVDVGGMRGAPPDPFNEWQIIPGRPLYGYVEPGAHPAYRTGTRPDSTTPDLVFAYVNQTSATGGGYYASGDGRYVLFTDGSLLTTLDVTVVSDPVLTPNDDGRAYTPKVGSRVDVDRYGAVAPGPVAELYRENAGPVHALGSPSYGTCPNACRIEPIRAEGSPVEGDLATVQGHVWAPYEREWREGGDSTGAGRRADYLERYGSWIDLLPRWGYAPAAAAFGLGAEVDATDMFVAPPGFAGSSVQSFPPGYFTVDVWVGVWRDASGEGAVGHARAGDVYEGGNRPLPDDYFNSKGEFLGVRPAGLTPAGHFSVTLVPKTTWGPLGVHRTISGVPVPSTEPDADVKPITVEARASVSAGHYRLIQPLFFPQGSVDFTVCTAPLGVAFAEAGVPHEETVWDCDTLASFEPR